MLKLPFAIFSHIGTLVLMGHIIWLSWGNLGPRKPEIGPGRQEIADNVISEIVEDLRSAKGNIVQIALLHLENDSTDYVTNKLRSTIEQRGVYVLRDTTVFYKTRELLNLRHHSYATKDAALTAARNLNVQGVLHGAVKNFESYADGSKIDVQIQLVDSSSRQTVFAKRYSVEAPQSSSLLSDIKKAKKHTPSLQRLFAWVIAVLLLPVFTISFVRTMVAKGSNKTNAFVLIIYTSVDVLLAGLLFSGFLTFWLPITLFICAIIAAFLYNVRIMTIALRIGEET